MFKAIQYKEIFDQRASSYHHAMLCVPSARDEEFEKAISLLHLQPNHLVLDFPAGGGYLGHYLPDQQILIHLESSSAFSELGNSGSINPNLVVDHEGLPFEGESVDRFVSIAGLHHIENKRALFSEIARVLRPGGRAVIADASAGGAVSQFLDVCVDDYNPMGHTGLYLSDMTLRELESSGLQVISDTEPSYTWHFESVDQMSQYCKSLFGMKKATQSQVLSGIDQYLGYRETGNQILMNWSLRFLVVVK
jgi:SAM-dependent methyltransferase